MKSRTLILSTISMALLLATVSFAQKIKADYDRSADFSRYRTFSWEKVQTSDALWVDRIQTAVDAVLAEKGWTRVPSGGDVSVIAIEMTQNQRSLNTFYNSFGGGWGWRRGGGGGFGTATTTTETYQVGTLVVDLFDGKSKKLFWRGSSKDTISNKSDTNIKNLDKGVRKMFEHFPPGAPRTNQKDVVRETLR